MSPKPSKLILIVLYRVEPKDSPTLQSLRNAGSMIDAEDTILVWDNSPNPSGSRSLDPVSAGSGARWIYRSTPENLSLAVIYNESTRLVPGKDLLLIFDHDSRFSTDFFSKLDAAVVDNPDIDLFVPLVRQGSMIVSPGHFWWVKGSLWKRARCGRQPSNHTVVIGSGMAIRTDFLEGFGGFEERLSLYGIDSNFMLRYARMNPVFFVIDPEFGHDMEDYQTHSPAVLRRRLDAFSYASRLNAELFSWPVGLMTEAFLAYKRISLRLRYGSADGEDRDAKVPQ